MCRVTLFVQVAQQVQDRRMSSGLVLIFEQAHVIEKREDRKGESEAHVLDYLYVRVETGRGAGIRGYPYK